MKARLVGLFLSIALVGVCYASAAAQDFNKSYSIGAGGRIRVQNVSGDIKVTGYDGNAVTVNAFKEGRDRDQVTVEDLSTGDSVDLRVKYPENCNNCNASIRFELQVPRNTNFNFEKLSTASGDIKITSVTGKLQVRTASGDVDVDDAKGVIDLAVASGDIHVKNASGSISAKSASGDVSVEIARLEGDENLEFSSASGDVNVVMPAGLEGEIEVSTLSGDLHTDFPLDVRERDRGPGKRATGRLGGGSRRIKIASVSGDVNLTRK